MTATLTLAYLLLLGSRLLEAHNDLGVLLGRPLLG